MPAKHKKDPYADVPEPKPSEAEAVDSDFAVDESPKEQPKESKTLSLSDQLSDVKEKGEVEYDDPKKKIPETAEDLEIPSDEKALKEARQRLSEPLHWKNPQNELIELRPFAYTDQQLWATMRAVNNGGLLDDAMMLVFILTHEKPHLRKLWRKNIWGAIDEETGGRDLVTCPLLDAFEDWKDDTFTSTIEASGEGNAPHDPISLYVEIFLRVQAAKTRELTSDDDDEKKTKSQPSGQTSNTST